MQRGRHDGNLRVQQRHRVGVRERLAAREQLVQGDAQRIQVAAVIDIKIGTPRLLRRHVFQGASPGCFLHHLMLAVEPAGKAEVAELELHRGDIHQYVLGRNVAMDQAVGVDHTDCACQLHGNVQAFGQIEWLPLNQLRQIGGAEVFQHQDKTLLDLLEPQRLDYPL